MPLAGNGPIATNEEAEAKDFLVSFLNIFDITRRRVATFEHRVKKLDDGNDLIDCLSCMSSTRRDCLKKRKKGGGNEDAKH